MNSSRGHTRTVEFQRHDAMIEGLAVGIFVHQHHKERVASISVVSLDIDIEGSTITGEVERGRSNQSGQSHPYIGLLRSCHSFHKVGQLEDPLRRRIAEVGQIIDIGVRIVGIVHRSLVDGIEILVEHDDILHVFLGLQDFDDIELILIGIVQFGPVGGESGLRHARGLLGLYLHAEDAIHPHIGCCHGHHAAVLRPHVVVVLIVGVYLHRVAGIGQFLVELAHGHGLGGIVHLHVIEGETDGVFLYEEELDSFHAVANLVVGEGVATASSLHIIVGHVGNGGPSFLLRIYRHLQQGVGVVSLIVHRTGFHPE